MTETESPQFSVPPMLMSHASHGSSELEAVANSLKRQASHRYENENLKIDKDIEPLRSFLLDRINTPNFEKFMGALIMLNFVIIAMQVDDEARCNPVPVEYLNFEACKADGFGTIYRVITITLLAIYTVEAACRMYVERLHYFKRSWNLLDIFVVVSGWVGEVIFDNGGMSVLRILRTARIVRAFRILVSFPELYYMVSSLGSLVSSLILGSIVLFGLLSLWSIILVEYVHPISITIDWDALGCERCARAYSSIMHSNLTLFQQLVTGDSWGTLNIAIIEEAPWTACILVSIVISITFGLTNMILAVILQRAEDARMGDKAAMAYEKQKEFDEMKDNLIAFCAKLDKDDSGNITFPELLRAWDDDADFRLHMKVIDIQKEDLALMFRVLDKDNSGEVTYLEFCNELGTIQSRDINTMMALMRLSIGELSQQVHTIKQAQYQSDKASRESTSAVEKGGGSPSPRSPAAEPSTTICTPGPSSNQAVSPGVKVQEHGLTASVKEPTIAERLFNQLCVSNCTGDLQGTPVIREDDIVAEMREKELDAIKCNLADYVEHQAASLVALLRAAESTPGNALAPRQSLAQLGAGRAPGSMVPAASEEVASGGVHTAEG